MRGYQIAIILLASLTSEAFATSSVVDSVHNLSVSGPGNYRSQTIDDVCVFCHTPHRGNREIGLWNRNSKPFQRYQSSSTEALPSPSYLKSAVCLSCHDGTVALGQLRQPPKSRKSKAATNDLKGTFLAGRSRFGTDMSNHHPVAITYDVTLSSSDKNLTDPSLIDLPLTNGELHCTTCHDPHDPDIPPFLNKTSQNGDLCTTCHQQSGRSWDWPSSSHAQSDAVPAAVNPWKERKPEWAGRSVAENSCMNCHASHNAATPERLVIDEGARVCFRCHNGSLGKGNIQSNIQQFSRHPVENSSIGRHDSTLTEDPYLMPLHVECEDCHNPHATRHEAPMISFNPSNPFGADHTIPPMANGSILGVNGIDINGGLKLEIEFEYEMCFKCHGLPGASSCGSRRCGSAENYGMQRQDQVYNLRDKTNSNNSTLQSYHPIETNNPANNDEVPSLRSDIPLNRSTSLIYCGDCHSAELSPAAGGNAAGGPHGSRFDGLLALQYDFNPGSRFNPARQSALCFKCHDTANLYSNESFPHRQHILDNGIACINCHDPHGSTIYPSLINFLTRSDFTGNTVEITGTGMYSEPTWIDNGRYSGNCYLNCHGTVHDGASYGLSGSGIESGLVK